MRVVCITMFLLAGCSRSAPVATMDAGHSFVSTLSSATPVLAPDSGKCVPDSGKCVARGALPDPVCTPGATMIIEAGVLDTNTICNTPTGPRRFVPFEVHQLAFTEYGYTYPEPRGEFEVDHLIPLELGGDNVIANLWAEPAEPRPGFHEKDKVENYLHKQVCSGAMTLADAQKQIATDWLSVWVQMEKGHGGFDGGLD